MTPSTLYEGTKRLHATPMTRGEYNAYRGWENPAGENPSDAGYLVEYQDGGKANDSRHAGYISWSPADVFERTYKPVSAVGMTFGQAIDAIKSGQRIARTGWNGKGMFVYLVPPASYPVQTGAAKAHFGEGAMVPYNAYMAIKNVDNTVSTWVPSVNDCLASDWGVVGHNIHKIQEDALLAGAQGCADMDLLCGSASFTVPIEQEIQAKASKGPRVTPAALQAEIVSEHYFTAFDGVAGAAYNEASPDGVLRPFSFTAQGALGLLTFCVLVLRNGAKVVGVNYGAIDPAQHSAERGRQEARAHAEDKVYELLGFRLRDELAR